MILPADSSLNRPNSYDDDDDEETDDEGSVPSMDSAIILHTPPLLITEHDSILHHEDFANDPITSSKPASSPSPPPVSSNTTAVNSSSAVSSEETASTAVMTNNAPATTSMNKCLYTNTLKQQSRPRSASDTYMGRERRNVSIEPNMESGPKREIRQDNALTPIKKTRVCPCTVKGEQYFHVALNETYKGTVEAVFKLLFDSEFIKGFLEKYENFEGRTIAAIPFDSDTDSQTDVQLGHWKHGVREVTGKRKIKSSTMGKVYKQRIISSYHILIYAALNRHENRENSISGKTNPPQISLLLLCHG